MTSSAGSSAIRAPVGPDPRGSTPLLDRSQTQTGGRWSKRFMEKLQIFLSQRLLRFESSPALRFKPDTALGYRHEKVGEPECPYLERWVFNFGPFALRLHHWMGSDDQRALHDHPWWFVTIVLKGGYTDISEIQRWYNPPPPVTKYDHLGVGSFRYRPALHRHTVKIDPGGCWTLLITGRKSRDWGFWVNGEWKRMRRYFREHGHHPCE